MKKTIKLFGGIAIVAVMVIICAFAACDDGSGKTTDPTLTSISAVYAQGGRTVYQTTPLDDLKTGLIVTAHYSDSTSQTVTTYTLSGTLTVGSSEITVTYAGKTAKFNVTVSGGIAPTLTSISAVYAQGGTTVYAISPLEDLKTGLTVTAHYSDSTSQTVTAYTLSGTLTAGTSEITVSYSGKTTKFNVTVSGGVAPTVTSISAVYTQGGTTVYPTTPLDDLKAGLIVTAHYNDSTSQIVTAYILSGTLTVGSSSVTVTYQGQSTSFTVNVQSSAPASVTVTFNINGGSGTTPNPITVNAGQSITLPSGSGFSRSGHTFGGWNTNSSGTGTNYNVGASYTGGTTTLWAKWLTENDADFGPGAIISNTFNVANASEWNNAVFTITTGGSGKNYIINITADFTVAGYTTNNTFGNVSGIVVVLRGADRILSLSSNGSILRIGAGQTVILRELSLQGISADSNRLVYVNANGTFAMNSGEISGNIGESSGGDGVYVAGSGTFTMHGGKISENSNGVYNDGIFTMNDGEIFGNYGTGIQVRGIFTMHNGEISENYGGVFVSGSEATFTMHGGEIFGNEGGSGVLMHNGGTFTMHGGKIFNNRYYNREGSGVCMERGGIGTSNSGPFTMYGGEIFGNDGHAVYVGGIFTMYDGKISGNFGTGVQVSWGRHFIMHGGEISGNLEGVQMYGGDFTMYDGIISGNTYGVYLTNLFGAATFRIMSGIIYGSDADDVNLRNGTALVVGSDCTAEYGMFIDDEWIVNSTLDTTDTTIKVVGGILQ
jgi:hypothetical protein